MTIPVGTYKSTFEECIFWNSTFFLHFQPKNQFRSFFCLLPTKWKIFYCGFGLETCANSCNFFVTDFSTNGSWVQHSKLFFFKVLIVNCGFDCLPTKNTFSFPCSCVPNIGFVLLVILCLFLKVIWLLNCNRVLNMKSGITLRAKTLNWLLLQSVSSRGFQQVCTKFNK